MQLFHWMVEFLDECQFEFTEKQAAMRRLLGNAGFPYASDRKILRQR